MASGIRVDNLNFAFADRAILKNISFDLQSGEALVLLGPSGVGKTTLLRILAGLLKPDTGDVHLESRMENVPSRIVFQEPRLFPWLSVRRNISFALRSAGVPKVEWEARMLPLLEQAGLTEAIDLPVQALSGGMAQRVALVRGLCVQPQALLLDEPFSALDPKLRAQLQDALLGLIRFTGVTVVMVTHDYDEAIKIGDEILFLDGEPATVSMRLRPKEAAAADGLTLLRQRALGKE